MISYLLDIQRCSTHDGPGIRTTIFFKGCPLSCIWCHNPESQCFIPQLNFNESICSQCGRCLDSCPNHVHTLSTVHHTLNRTHCTNCGTCTTVCPTNALSMKGQPFDLDEVMAIILKDKAYYSKSNGGITLSGGEVLSHTPTALMLLKACKSQGIHTCIETSGFGKPEYLELLLPYIDLVLYDYKLTDPQLHKTYTGGDLSVILANLHSLQLAKKQVILRCPIIPSINDTDEHFQGIAHLTRLYDVITGVELLPYHSTGKSKALTLGLVPQTFPIPTPEMIFEWTLYCQNLGVELIKSK